MLLGDLPVTRRSLQPIQTIQVGEGNDAIVNTLKLMSNLITTSAKDYYVRSWAETIIANLPKDNLLAAQTIFDFLATHTKYSKEAGEMIKTPAVSLQLIETGDIPVMDCDCYVVLILSLYSTLGYSTIIRAASYDTDQELSHVYGLVLVNGTWYAVDLTNPISFGWEAEGATNVVDMEVQ